MSKTKSQLNETRRRLGHDLMMKDLGTPTSFLGLQIKWHDGKIPLSQNNLILKLLSVTRTLKSKAMQTPMIENPDSSRTDMKRLENEERIIYRSIVGSLSHLAIRPRPDISVAESVLGIHI